MSFAALLKTRFWWIAAAVILVAEMFVFLRSLPEKKRWAAEPVLTLDLDEANRESGGYRFVDQPDRLGGAVEQLTFSKGQCGVFLPAGQTGGGGPSLDFFYFEYEPGNSRFLHDVFGHAPEVCMRSTGAALKQEHPERTIVVEGRSMPVKVLEFVSPVSTSPLWFFRFTWLPENAPFKPYDTTYMMREAKVKTGLFGNPKPPARVLLAGAMGYESLDAAWSAYNRLLVDHLKITPP